MSKVSGWTHDDKQTTATAAALNSYLEKGGTITHCETVTSYNAKPRPPVGRWWRPQSTGR